MNEILPQGARPGAHGPASPFSRPRRLPAAAVPCTSGGEPPRPPDGLQVRRPDR